MSYVVLVHSVVVYFTSFSRFSGNCDEFLNQIHNIGIVINVVDAQHRLELRIPKKLAFIHITSLLKAILTKPVHPDF